MSQRATLLKGEMVPHLGQGKNDNSFNILKQALIAKAWVLFGFLFYWLVLCFSFKIRCVTQGNFKAATASKDPVRVFLPSTLLQGEPYLSFRVGVHSSFSFLSLDLVSDFSLSFLSLSRSLSISFSFS